MPLSDRDRRSLKIGGIVAGGLIVVLLAVSQLGKGGASSLPPLSPVTGTPTGSTGPSTTPSVGPSGSPSPGGPSASPIFSGRDPFSLPPQFVSASATTSTSPSGSTSPTSSSSSSPSATPTAPSNGSSTVVGGHTVVLIDTFTKNGVQMATVEVDGTVYNVAEGDTFAGGTFTLRDVAGNCATFLYGDQSFTLCIQPQK